MGQSQTTRTIDDAVHTYKFLIAEYTSTTDLVLSSIVDGF
jgi:hypothetical protein